VRTNVQIKDESDPRGSATVVIGKQHANTEETKLSTITDQKVIVKVLSYLDLLDEIPTFIEYIKDHDPVNYRLQGDILSKLK